MSRKLYYVGRSGIHGRGLFAKKRIRAGEKIGCVRGVRSNVDGRYVLWLNDHRGIKVTCSLRFINHSQTANAVYYDTLEVIAKRDIDAGEEITHDYCATG